VHGKRRALSDVRDVLEPAFTGVLMRRDIRDIDEFLRQPSFSDLPDPFSIPNLRAAIDRVLLAIKGPKRIAIFGDYDCEGVLASHILQAGLQ
jgi:single-stranded-DNA-specific exonuclease